MLWRSLKRKVWNDTGGGETTSFDMWQHGQSCARSSSKRKTQKKCMGVLVRKIPHLIYLYLPKIQTNSTTMLSTFFLGQNHMQHFFIWAFEPKICLRGLCAKMPHTQKCKPQLRKTDTTIEILVKSYSENIYNICHLVEGFENSGKIWIPFELHLKQIKQFKRKKKGKGAKSPGLASAELGPATGQPNYARQKHQKGWGKCSPWGSNPRPTESSKQTLPLRHLSVSA